MEEQQYIQAFNNGYLLPKYEAELAAKLAVQENSNSDYQKALLMGKQQFEKKWKPSNGQKVFLREHLSGEAFKVMEHLIVGIVHVPSQNKFIDSLSRKKPFTNFNSLSYHAQLRKDWFACKNQSNIDFVKDQVERHNNMEEFDEEL